MSAAVGFHVMRQREQRKCCLQRCLSVCCHPCEGRDPEGPRPKRTILCTIRKKTFLALDTRLRGYDGGCAFF
jgi:hypothetical protein